ncbi:MAG TPA: glycosyltransferase family 4 protein [Planctomycetota bacterium]|nr:glycosyltransferase family 4 protein [Planctomycetota bacterium]
MNILYSLDNYDHDTGGAGLAARALAQRLAALGHHVEVLQRGGGVTRYDDGPVRVHTRPLPRSWLFRDRDLDTLRWNEAWRPMLEDYLSRHCPDLVLTQNRLLVSTVDVSRARNIPVVVFVHAYSMFCLEAFVSRDPLSDCDRRCSQCLPWWSRLRYGWVQRNLDEYERAIRAAQLVVANSRYMQDVIRRFYGLEAEVVYPTADLEPCGGDAALRQSVLFVKPQQVKGLPIFLEIARRMPGTRFLVAGSPSWRGGLRLRCRPNVERLGWVADMQSVYARSRVVLGPSIWPEPFGRVFVEAGACGVPAVASRRGGIPEAVGEGGILIDDVFDVSRWVGALRQLDDPAAFAACSARAREHARRFAPDTVMRQFTEAVRRTLGIAL